VIFANALPKIKTFLRPAALSAAACGLVVRLIAAFIHHPGRMSASQAAGAIRSRARHRAQLARFLARCHWSKDWSLLAGVADLLLQREARRDGARVFLLDQTYCGQQGVRTENTFSRANYRPRAKKCGRQQKKHARRSCHGFVMGLLLTPSGLRLPCCRCYYTRDYRARTRRDYHTQPQLAAELIRRLAVPEGARVVAPGDTAFAADGIRIACAARGYRRIVPVNPERVPAGAAPRPKVRSLSQGWSAEHFEAVRLVPGQGAYAARQRAARCRVGPKAKARTFRVRSERRAVHPVGDVLLVFSTKEQPQPGRVVDVQKILMSNAADRTAAAVVAL
jgi:hypothetical protein